MISRRRLDRLEASLTPTAAVCLWLEEAHAFGSIPAYLAWITNQPRAAGPVTRIRGQVRADVERRFRGQPRTSIEQAAETAGREACFRIALVFELNAWTATELHITALEHDLLFHIAYVLDLEGDRINPASTTSGADLAGLDSTRAHLARTVAVHSTKLRAAAEACTDLERRYLGGQAALFPDLAAERQRLLDNLPSLVDYVRAIAPWRPEDRGTAGDVPISDLDPAALHAAVRARAPIEAATRVAEARITTYQLLGEYRQAGILAGRLLRRALHDPPSPPSSTR